MMAELDILNGFASKVISDCIDISVKAIKNADKNRKAENRNIEEGIYQIIIDALNKFTNNDYAGKDKLYDAAEKILKGFKIGRNPAEAVRQGLKRLYLQVTADICDIFLEGLCHEVCRAENSDLYKEITMLRGIQESKYVHGEFDKNAQNHEETHRKLDHVIEKLNDHKEDRSEQCNERRIENRAEEYAEKWNKNVFMNNFSERDEDAGENIKLSELYLEEHLPHYIWKANKKPRHDLKDLLREYIVENVGKKMLLILGQPGIGKSTLITWIISKFIEKRDKFLVYQFASDLKNINWQSENILDEILGTLNLKQDNLEKGVLILDGFDELCIDKGREEILNQLYQELYRKRTLKNFSIIITCRENYIYRIQNIECDYITLQAWDDKQIESFCDVFERKSKKSINTQKIKVNKILENKEILGIPLILYMVLALNIAVENNTSIMDIYDQIFSLDKGGIYSRCIKNLRYGEEHRISEPKTKQMIHKVSQRIAFWIFENNSEEAFISQTETEEICKDVLNEMSEENEKIEKDYLIGNYFSMKHCEGIGTDEVRFVHRTIYEYFVVIYFLESLRNITSKEEAAGKLGVLLKAGDLSGKMLEFIKYKFDTMYKYNLPDVIKQIFQIMLQDGMTYYTGIPYNKNVIEQERNIFSNMLELVRLWNPVLGEVDNRIAIYLQCNRKIGLQLRGIKFNLLTLFRID